MEKQINRTLLNNLFENPNPLEDKKNVFLTLYNRLFPDKSAFKFFLSTNNYDEQIRVSKVIIQRICFESNYPPAYDLLMNLLQYENTDENKAQTRYYTPQDHFVHIVNSYIFGIYLFFYHPILSSKLTNYFIGARKDEANSNPVLNATKDFISFWKYFCLFHDIAYPIEGAFRYSCDGVTDFFKDKNRTEKVAIRKKSDDSLKYITAFQNIQDYNIKEWGAAAVARFLTVLDLFYDTSNKTADKLFLNNKATYITHPNNGESTSCHFGEISQIAVKYVCVDKLLSYEHFKLLSGFINPEDTLIVVVDNYTLIPVALKYYNDGEKVVCIINQSRYYDKVDTVIDSIFEDEEDYTSSRFSVRFCIKDPDEKIKAIMPSWGYDRLTREEIQDIRLKISQVSTDNGLPSDSNVRFSNITDASELDDYSFGIFKNVFDYLGEEFIGNSNTSVFDQIVSLGTDTEFQKYLRKSIADSEVSKIPCYLSDLLKQRMTNSINSLVVENVNQVDSIENIVEDKNLFITAIGLPINKTITGVISRLQEDNCENNIRILAESLYNIVYGSIEQQNQASSSTVQFLSEFLLKIYNPLSASNIDLCKQFFGTLGDKNWKDLPHISLIACREEAKEIVTSIDNVVKRISSNILSADNLCKEYMNQHVALDHGIWGGYVYLISEIMTCNSINMLFSIPHDKINMASAIPYFIWPISNSLPNAYEIKLKSNYDLISKETAKAIFVHNIYGDFIGEIPFIKEEKYSKDDLWNIDLNTEPCVFFALLVDALQKWDRKQYFSPKLDYRSLYEADSFDIQIVDKKLRISVRCHSRDFKTIETKFCDALDSYLTCASELIDLKFF